MDVDVWKTRLRVFETSSVAGLFDGIYVQVHTSPFSTGKALGR